MLGISTHVHHAACILCGAQHVCDSLGLALELVLHIVLLLALPGKGYMQLCQSPRLLKALQLRLVDKVLITGAAAEK